MCAVNEEREVGCGGTRGQARVWEKVRDWCVGAFGGEIRFQALADTLGFSGLWVLFVVFGGKLRDWRLERLGKISGLRSPGVEHEMRF